MAILVIDGEATATTDMTEGQLAAFRRDLAAVNDGINGLWDLIGGPDCYGYPDVKDRLYRMTLGFQELRANLEARERAARATKRTSCDDLQAEIEATSVLED